MATWSWLQFKQGKSRSLCILKEKLSRNTFSIQGAEIPTTEEQGIRFLGKCYECTLKDSTNLKDTIAQLTIWLKEIDNRQQPAAREV